MSRVRTRESRPPLRTGRVARKALTAETTVHDSARDLVRKLPWQPYRTRRIDSGVRAFALLEDGIAVEFVGGAVYLYTTASAGRACITRMHAAALAGRGLSTLISRNARRVFAEKLIL